MGFQDRDYNRYEPYDDYGYRRRRGTGLSMTMRIVIVNFVLWFANGLLFSDSNLLSGLIAIVPETLTHPVLWWKYLTYGFAHSPADFWHIAGNMFGLVMFGYGMMLGIGPNGFGLVRGENIEDRLGRVEYLVFYLLAIIVSGIVFSVVSPGVCLGASGGVTAVIILYALFYPTKTLLIYGIIPMPMWAIGAFLVFMDVRGASGVGDGGIAYAAHLGGAGFALVYYFIFVQQGRGITDGFTGLKKLFKRKPKLHIYKNDDPPKRTAGSVKSAKDDEFEKRLDEILDRYGKVGESGLTKEERDFLQRASKKYRDKNN